MRVPVQAPALVRIRRSRLVDRFDRRRVDANGVSPSQLGSEEEGEGTEEGEGGEGAEGAESGEEGADAGDASVESE